MTARTSRLDSYHSGKVFEHTGEAMKALAVGGYDYKARLIWCIEEFPMIEFYLERLRQPLQRPATMIKHSIDPVDISRSQLIVAITRMHWRDMHKLGREIVDWLSMAEGIAHDVQEVPHGRMAS